MTERKESGTNHAHDKKWPEWKANSKFLFISGFKVRNFKCSSVGGPLIGITSRSSVSGLVNSEQSFIIILNFHWKKGWDSLRQREAQYIVVNAKWSHQSTSHSWPTQFSNHFVSFQDLDGNYQWVLHQVTGMNGWQVLTDMEGNKSLLQTLEVSTIYKK